jgi:hypothetical protein
MSVCKRLYVAVLPGWRENTRRSSTTADSSHLGLRDAGAGEIYSSWGSGRGEEGGGVEGTLVQRPKPDLIAKGIEPLER